MNPPLLEAPAAHAASILIVDDAAANLQVLAGMLKERGYKVRPAPSGKLALLAARRDPPDLILLDINMPEMNGYEVCEHLKGDAGLKDIPIIFISALTEPLDKVKAFGLGGVDYITKPFQMEELHARVETHLKLRGLQIQLERANRRLDQANRRMSSDLAAAATIQKSFLPRAEVDLPGAKFAWCYTPCDELGGDGLNIIPLGDGKVGMYILDVSGHGVPSALLSVTMSRLLSAPSDASSILVRSRGVGTALEITLPAEVADRLNALFPFQVETREYTTLLYGVLDLATGDFRYVCAGHAGPMHVPAAGSPKILEAAASPIGMAERSYVEQAVHLAAGGRLYLYSDGLSDARSPAGEPFGNARLMNAARRASTSCIRAGLDDLIAEVTRWQGGEPSQDDISVLAVELASP